MIFAFLGAHPVSYTLAVLALGYALGYAHRDAVKEQADIDTAVRKLREEFMEGLEDVRKPAAGSDQHKAQNP